MADYNRMNVSGIPSRQDSSPPGGDTMASLLADIDELENLDMGGSTDLPPTGGPPPASSTPPPAGGAGDDPDMPPGTDTPPPAEPAEAEGGSTTNNSARVLEEFTPSQTFGLLAVVWVLLVVSIVGAILFNVIGGKKDKGGSGGILSAGSGNSGPSMGVAPLETFMAEEASHKDAMVISKQLIWEDSSVIPVFVGTPIEYGYEVSIPVDMAKYNMISSGATIQITYKRLQIDGEEKIVIIKWQEVK